ncbi:hypothetical protein HGA88_00810 [Candidatus Roizmanbacteria bacterium]|nr:hypothetical protein [Candidatus Roizmanbacteria bacterium]
MRKSLFIVVCIAIISLALQIYKGSVVPPGFNADEAAFGYNAYSLSQTAKDEYGSFLPVRLKSFGDYKMPLYSYLSVPIIQIFGLSETSTRALNSIVAFILPFAIFFLAVELFKKTKIGYLAAFLVSTSLGLHLVGRHTHEAYLTVLLLTLTMLFLVRSLKKPTILSLFLFIISLALSLNSYQSSRVIAFFMGIFSLGYLLYKKNGKAVVVTLCIVGGIFFAYDAIHQPPRVKNLLLTSSKGFQLKIDELRGEGGSQLLYNKLTVGVRDIVQQHLVYFSPQFLASEGDENARFGSPDMSPITIIEYLFSFIGIYYLFKNKEKWRYLLLFVWITTPFAGSLSWNGTSLTRSLFMLIPTLLFSAYGLYYFIQQFHGKKRLAIIGGIAIVQSFFLFYSWDYYFNHYPKRAATILSFQAGYRELTDYVKKQYSKTDTFYITKKNGEPYIFFLFYLKYPPEKYHKQAKLTGPDEYGFGQVESFDKFQFHFVSPVDKPKSIIVGYPDDFNGISIPDSQLRKIRVGTQDIFWIYDPYMNK